jgi:hypothetical protein
VGINQVLVDGRGVTPEAKLRFDEGAVGLAQGGGHRGGRQQTSRWPGWSSLAGRGHNQVGGHPGAVWIVGRLGRRIALGFKALGPGADGVAGYAGAALDLALGVARAQERPDRGL